MIKRKLFFKSVLLLLIGFSFGVSRAQQHHEKPNIILILTDDQRADALGYAGNREIETPEMDKLAEEGTYFKNAFATTPICAASRASILTGLYERTHGYTFLTGNLKDEYMDISYPVRMRQNGYLTGFFGKFGVEYDDAEKLFDFAEIYDRSAKYKDRRGYFYKTIDGDTVHLTRYTGYQATEFIKHIPEGKPFCLSLSFSAPHAHDPAPKQYFWQEKSNGRYNDVTIPLPLLAEDHYFQALPKEVRAGFNRVRWHWRYDTPEKYQHSVKGYYRMITEIDEEIGLIREELKRKGLDKNTIIIFLSDNGLFQGERQLAGKWLMYEQSIRIPMVIFDPRVDKQRDVAEMVLNIDIPKTILEYAGVVPPPQYQGINLDTYIRGGQRDARQDGFLIEHLWDFPAIPSTEGLRTKKWKYIRYRSIQADEELYNLKKDSLEEVNVAKYPKYQRILSKLRSDTDTLIGHYQCRTD